MAAHRAVGSQDTYAAWTLVTSSLALSHPGNLDYQICQLSTMNLSNFSHSGLESLTQIYTHVLKLFVLNLSLGYKSCKQSMCAAVDNSETCQMVYVITTDIHSGSQESHWIGTAVLTPPSRNVVTSIYKLPCLADSGVRNWLFNS